MLKKLLLFFGSVLFASVQGIAATAARPFADDEATSSAVSAKRRALTAEQLRTIEAVQGPSREGIRNLSTSSFARLSSSSSALSAPMKVNASGSTLQGYCRTYYSDADGWYEVKLDGSQDFIWEYDGSDYGSDWNAGSFPFNVGFLRNGKVYASASKVLYYWLVEGHGVFSLDGEILEYSESSDILDDLSGYVMSCAYDPNADLAYAYTLNSDATSYMFQTIEPDSWSFTVVNSSVALEDVCVGFAWNPADEKLYGLTSDGRFVTIDPTSGALTTLKRLDMPATTSMCGFVYSPFDKHLCSSIPRTRSRSSTPSTP